MPDNAVAAPFFAQRSLSGHSLRTPKTAEIIARTLRRMIVDGDLRDGDRLPHEADLMAHFAVSRPTLREAVRVLEAERLVEVRRGSRSGARVCIPGPEVAARPASLLLELSDATVADLFAAREAIEAAAARTLVECGSQDVYDEFDKQLDDEVLSAFTAGDFESSAARLHVRMVQLSGNATLTLIAGMLDDILERHTSKVDHTGVVTDVEAAQVRFKRFVRSLRQLIKLFREHDIAGVSTHWNKHAAVTRAMLLADHGGTPIRSMLD